jgi:hypothetical protein
MVPHNDITVEIMVAKRIHSAMHHRIEADFPLLISARALRIDVSWPTSGFANDPTTASRFSEPPDRSVGEARWTCQCIHTEHLVPKRFHSPSRLPLTPFIIGCGILRTDILPKPRYRMIPKERRASRTLTRARWCASSAFLAEGSMSLTTQPSLDEGGVGLGHCEEPPGRAGRDLRESNYPVSTEARRRPIVYRDSLSTGTQRRLTHRSDQTTGRV